MSRSPEARITLKTGVSMYYRRCGHGSSSLVFLHGGGGWSEHWKGQMEVFSKTATTLAPDLRGHGRTDAPSGRYTIETFADDLIALLDELDIRRPVLVGHSLGGLIALRCAFDFPDRVSGLVIVDSGCRAPDRSRDAWRSLVVARVQDRKSSEEALSRYRSVPRSGRAEVVEEVLRATPEPRPGIIDAAHYGIITFCSAAAASFITCPTLIIGAGAMDYWPSVAAWKEYIPHALLVSVPDCAHYIMIEQPERFNGELTAFLMDIRSNAAPSGESRITPPGFMERLPRDTDHDA